MFGKIYRTTIKTTLRNPATLLSLIAVGLLWYNLSDIGLSGLDVKTPYHRMLKMVTGWAIGPLTVVLPAFAAVVCSVGILQDKKNRFYDIEKVTGMKTRAYYLGKLAAFATVCYGLLILVTAGWIAVSRFFGVYRDLVQVMDLPDMLTRVVRTGVVYSIPSVFVYISIPVTVSLLTGSAVAGISSGVVYSLIGRVFTYILHNNHSFFGSYLYPISWKTLCYMYYYDSDEFAIFITSVSSNVDFRTSFEEMVLSIVLTVATSLILLAVGYVALRRKES